MITDIFKVPTYTVSLNLDNQNISKYCFDFRQKHTGRQVSNIGGWQSEDLQGKHLPLNSLFLEIEKHIKIFSSQIGLTPNLCIDNLWININGYKDYNRQHSHPVSIISGVYYVKIPNNAGDIAFDNPFGSIMEVYWHDYVENQKKENWNAYTSAEWTFPSLEGSLYLFPGWLKHYVEPNLNQNEERISISFNSKIKD